MIIQSYKTENQSLSLSPSRQMTTIKLDVNHSGLGMEFTELPFASTLTLGKVKDKLYPRTGTEVQHQQLSLNGRVLEDNAATLEEIGLVTGDRLELVDTNEASVSNTLFDGAADAAVPKVTAPADAGFAAFRKKAAKPKRVPATADTGREGAALYAVGQRVVVKKRTKECPAGVVRFIGPIDVLPAGFWCGVELDSVEGGKHDGSVKGTFLWGPCGAKQGVCVRPSSLAVEDEGKEEEL